ncbi:RICIN domain-containing protein [Clostridium sp. YIM B02551]|uniref:RICIN domain-containing protein n=1 Tax=Clostridium sp. YIM B02551 TaxID=2910679 RepID=UPI001EEA7EFB|nr:RICIN domain-containing protein [Clostridium sp. YIM B02551]
MSKKLSLTKALVFASMLATSIIVAHPLKTSAAVVSGQTYKLINVGSGKALDVYAAGTTNYTNVDIYTDNGTGAQQWRIVQNSDGTYKLINVNSNKALDVYAAGNADYTNVDIYDDNNTGAQKWNIIQNSDGSYKLINTNSWKALDVYADGNADYTNVDIYTDNGTAAQKWNIVPVNGGSNPSVNKPSEVPSDIWTYAINADKKYTNDGDFALLLCAVMKKESYFGAGLGGSPSSGDGLMQVEPNTRNAYAAKFQAKYGYAYNHGSYQDQVYLGALILNENIVQFGSVYNGLLHYNGGPNWYPGATDSYGRVIEADKYANEVYGTYRSYGGKR